MLYLSTEHKEYVNSVELVSASLSQGSSSGMGESLPGPVLDTSVIAKERVFEQSACLHLLIKILIYAHLVSAIMKNVFIKSSKVLKEKLIQKCKFCHSFKTCMAFFLYSRISI